MLNDELEFSISQYIDGTLDAEQSRAIEETLATDPRARELFNSYERMNTLLVRAAHLPTMDWDRVHSQIVSTIDSAEAEEESSRRSRFQIAGYSRWVGSAVAVAAAVLIVLSIQLRHSSTNSNDAMRSGGTIAVDISPGGAGDSGVVAINSTGGGSSTDNTPLHATLASAVSIGPGPEVASSADFFAEDATDGRGGRVMIAGDVGTASPVDSNPSPFQ